MLANRVHELEAAGFSEDEIIEELTILAHESGFLLSNMISEDDQASGKSLLDVVKEHFSVYEAKFPEPTFGYPRRPSHHDEHQHKTDGLHQRNRKQRRSMTGNLLRRSVMLAIQINMIDTGYFPWENQDDAHDFVKGLREYMQSFLTCFILMFLCNANLIITFADHKMVLSTWGMMYCGGSKPVENTLRQISRVYNISLHPESFAW